MIALDTNILLRYLVQDDPAQSAAANRLFEQQLTPERPGFVSITALLELDWVLRSQYQFSAANVAATLKQLVAADNLVCEYSAVLPEALDYEHGDLADNILHLTARASGCSQTLTFDKTFARRAGVELLR